MAETQLNRPLSPEYLKTAGEWDRSLLRYMNARRITDPHLVQAAEDYAKRLNVVTPLLYVADEFAPIHDGRMPNAIAMPIEGRGLPGAIAFTHARFSVHDYVLHSGMKPPKEVLSTLGHEMAHIKQGARYLTAIQKYPKLAGGAGFVAAAMLLDTAIARARKKQKEAVVSGPEVEAALAGVAQEEQEKIRSKLYDAADSHVLAGPLGAIERVHNAALAAGKYLAAAAIGCFVGRFGTRQFVLAAEFDADKVGAQLCGDPRARIRCIKAARDYVRNMPVEELRNLNSQITLRDAFYAYFEGAHPEYEERIARLEAMARQMEKHAAATVDKAKSAVGAVIERAPTLLADMEKAAVRLHIP